MDANWGPGMPVRRSSDEVPVCLQAGGKVLVRYIHTVWRLTCPDLACIVLFDYLLFYSILFDFILIH